MRVYTTLEMIMEIRVLRVFENKLLKKIFGMKRDEVMGGWRKLHNEEQRDLYLQNIIRIIKLWRIRLAGQVAQIGERRNLYRLMAR
jgi:hypothetical protein